MFDPNKPGYPGNPWNPRTPTQSNWMGGGGGGGDDPGGCLSGVVGLVLIIFLISQCSG